MAKHKDLFFLEKEFQNRPFPSQCPKTLKKEGERVFSCISALFETAEGRLSVGV